MKINDLTLRQHASKANAIAAWRKRVAKSCTALNKLTALLTRNGRQCRCASYEPTARRLSNGHQPRGASHVGLCPFFH
jgi:hypothetical protein